MLAVPLLLRQPASQPSAAQVKSFFVGKDHVGDVPLTMKIAAGLATGAIGISVASPTDLVKVRMQSEGKLPPGAPKKYPNAVKAYGIILRWGGGWLAAADRGAPAEPPWSGGCSGSGCSCSAAPVVNSEGAASPSAPKPLDLQQGRPTRHATPVTSHQPPPIQSPCAGTPRRGTPLPIPISREEGLLGLWKGLGPNIARNAIINAAELASYDQIKEAMLGSGMFQVGPWRRQAAARCCVHGVLTVRF